MVDFSEIMDELSRCDAPSGFEAPAISETAGRLLAKYMDEVRVDVLGNTVGVKRCGRENAKKLLLDAHVDEIGFIITGYEEGFLKFSAIGGIDLRTLPASEVKILTEPPVYGVIDTMPPHVLKAGEMDSAIDINDLFIDVGMTAEEAAEKIPLGTAAVYNSQIRKIGGRRLCGKALDDRSCFAVILRALEIMGDSPLDADLYVMASAQEEVGVRGAAAGAFAIAPDYAIVLDVGHAEVPGAPKEKTVKMGGGGAIGIGPNMNRKFTDYIRKTAEENGIPYQLEVIAGMSGTNARAIQTARDGAATALISLPLKYMHTPVEIVDTDDCENCARLLSAAVLSFKGGLAL